MKTLYYENPRGVSGKLPLTVQQLIDVLQTVEDKSQRVWVHDVSISEITEDRTGVSIR